MAEEEEYVELLYKVLVIGDVGTGKTSIVRRLTQHTYEKNYKATIGVDFALKTINYDQNTVIKLQLWDIAGQEKFANMTRVFYKEAAAAIVVYDISKPNTFPGVLKWKEDLDTKVFLHDGQNIPAILFANKSDLPREGNTKTPEELKKFCDENGFITWYETSAKDNINIDTAVKLLVERILKDDPQFTTRRDTNLLTLSQPPPTTEQSQCYSSC